jgi:hypothetical protein
LILLASTKTANKTREKRRLVQSVLRQTRREMQDGDECIKETAPTSGFGERQKASDADCGKNKQDDCGPKEERSGVK